MGVAGVTPIEVLEWLITPTQTAFKLRAGPVDFTVTFLSPVQVRPIIRASRTDFLIDWRLGFRLG